MKTTLIALGFALTSLFSFAQGTNRLVAHWKFSGDASDASGNGLLGTMVGPVGGPGYNGIPNTALYFNGVNDHVDVPYSSFMEFDSFSVCALLKVHSFYSGLCQGNNIISRDSAGSPDGFDLLISDHAYDQNCSTFSPTHENFEAAAQGAFPGAITVWAAAPVLDTVNWVCVVVSYNGATMKEYFNGALAATVTWPNAFVGGSTAPINIGYYAPGGTTWPYWFNGWIDDMRIYSRALSSTEVGQYCDTAKMPDVAIGLHINTPFSISSVCTGVTFNVSFTAAASFSAGNVFTAQLSDASGAFGTPVNIGSLASRTSGIIACTIPSGTPVGTHYRVRIIASNPSLTSADDGSDISVHSFTVPVITTNGPVCIGNTLIVTTIDTQSGVVYSWSGPHSYSGATKSFSIPNAQTVDSGMYRLTLVDPNGCRDTVFVTGSVIPSGTALTVTISANPGNLICVNLPVTFTAVSTVGGVSYQWKINGSNVPGATGSTYTTSGLTNGSVVTCVVNAGSSCITPNTATSNPITMQVTTGITLILSPIIMTPAKFVAGATDTFSVNVLGYPSSNFTFQWIKNGTNIPGATTDPYITNTLHTSDKITVMVKSKLPCSTPDSALSSILSLGVENTLVTSGNVTLYPNPNKGDFTVVATNIYDQSATIEVLNIVGQVIYKSDVVPRNGSVRATVNLNNAIPGMYFLKVHAGNENKVMRFTVSG